MKIIYTSRNIVRLLIKKNYSVYTYTYISIFIPIFLSTYYVLIYYYITTYYIFISIPISMYLYPYS